MCAAETLQVRLSDLPLQEKVALMDRAIGRFTGYVQGMLQCAKAALVLESKQMSPARDLVAHIQTQYADDPIVLRAALGVGTAVRQALGE